MNDFFDQCFDFLVLKSEGSVYTNDPKDPGGPTKFGITLKSFENYLGRLVLANEIKDLTIEEAKKFYFDTSWKPMKLGQLTRLSVVLSLFDTAALYGNQKAVFFAQRAASICGGTLKIDGIVGDETIKVLNIIPEVAFLKEYREQVLSRIDEVITRNPTLEKFRGGWTNRADRLLTLNSITPSIKGTT